MKDNFRERDNSDNEIEQKVDNDEIEDVWFNTFMINDIPFTYNSDIINDNEKRRLNLSFFII